MTLYIRHLTVDDAGALFALVESNRAFLEPWIEWVPVVKDSCSAAQLIDESTGDIIGAWFGLGLVGCVVFQSQESGKTMFSALMSEQHCGSGIATRLFDVCYGNTMNYCPGCYVYCNVSTRNVRSTRYVQKLGFVPTGQVDGEMVEYARKVG